MVKPTEIVFNPEDFREVLLNLDTALRQSLNSFEIPISLELLNFIKKEYSNYWKIENKQYKNCIKLIFTAKNINLNNSAPRIFIKKAE